MNSIVRINGINLYSKSEIESYQVVLVLKSNNGKNIKDNNIGNNNISYYLYNTRSKKTKKDVKTIVYNLKNLNIKNIKDNKTNTKHNNVLYRTN